MFCPTCGCENPEGSVICSVCGNALSLKNQSDNEKVIPKTDNKKTGIVITGALIVVILFFVLIASYLIVKNDSGQLKANERFSCGVDVIVAVNDDGTVTCDGNYGDHYNLSDWKDIKTVAAGDGVIVGLKKDGKVIAASDNEDELLPNFKNDISKWENICSISFELSTGLLAGVKSDGTVVITGCYNDVSSSTLDVSNLKDVVEVDISAFDGEYPYMLALKNNGTVEKIIDNEYFDEEDIDYFDDLIDISEWKNMKAIYAYDFIAYGITKSGELKMTLNSSALKKYFVSPAIIEENLSNQEKNIANQMTDLYEKMYEDMLKRTEKYKISHMVRAFDDYSIKTIPYYDDFNEWPVYRIYLLLDDGTVVTESPYLSLYYYVKDLSGDELYNKVKEYMNCKCDYDDFFDDWYKYCDACEEMISETSLLRNIVAIDVYRDFFPEDQQIFSFSLCRDAYLMVLCGNGEVSAADEISDDDNLKTEKPNEKIKKSNDEKFYKGKYYLTYDENGEFVIYAFEIVDDNIIRVTYFEPPDFSNYTFVDAYYADRKDNKLYNQDIGFEFIIDVDLQKIKYKDESRTNYEVLKEVDDLSEKTLKKYAEEIL